MMTRVNALIAARATIAAGLTPVLLQLKDTSVPLDERWEAFIALIDGDVLTSTETYGDGKLSVLGPNFSMYDDFDTDRNQTLMYDDMYAIIVDNDDDLFVDANIDAWREAVLASGHAGFEYDW